MSSIKILSFFQIIKIDFQSCALCMSWNGPSVWVLTICAILFIHEISAMLFSLNLDITLGLTYGCITFEVARLLACPNPSTGFKQLSNENLQYTTSSIASIQFQELYLNPWLPLPIPNFLPPFKKEFGIAIKIKCE